MAQFCEVLAETAVVAEACEQVCMGISGARAFRRRNAFIAAAARKPTPSLPRADVSANIGTIRVG